MPQTRPSREPTALPLDPDIYARAAQACVHCGLCLPACPTYNVNGREEDSPRGRIHIMKAMADGRIGPEASARRHLDLCLDCRACEPACPSGVVFHELLEQTRHLLAQQHHAAPGRLIGWFNRHVMTRPFRLKLALIGPRLLQLSHLWPAARWLGQRVLPRRLATMQQLLPSGRLWEARLARRYRPVGDVRMTVGFHHGCVSSVLAQQVNRKAIELLTMHGCEVVVPRGQRCCGAIDHHTGHVERARALARRNIELFEQVDFVVSAVAGCGAMLKEYDRLFADDRLWADRAAAVAGRTRDIHQMLGQLRIEAPRGIIERRVVYHDACHLAHAQGIRATPRRLLSLIPGLALVPLREADMCCGADRKSVV